VLVVAVPVGALALYLRLGAPEVPSVPFASQPPAAMAPAQQAEFSALADQLAAKLEADPAHPDGWLLLGRTYAGLERYADSAHAFAQAIAHGATGAEVQADYGEVLVFAANGKVTPEAAAAFAAALTDEPGNVRGRFYLALERAQAKQFDLALAQWLALEKDLPPDHPWRRIVGGAIGDAARELGLDPANIPGRAQPPAPQGQ
jgi:cytochrome c-type biogenesis protein CcmH